MKSFQEMEYHPTVEKLANMLCQKTNNTNPLLFRVMVTYYLCLAASMMRCQISTPDRGKIPVNMYAIGLATSGSGKGYAINVLEEQVLNQFLDEFKEQSFPLMAMQNLPKIANDRALRTQNDPDDELVRVEKEFKDLGPLALSFDSATPAAIKQARQKLLMAKAGALNLQIDEIGSNLTGNVEGLTTFLELYDVGKIKQKLVKNTAENARYEEIVGRTPTNLMLFGTPSRLLNGGKVEDEFYTMLDTGYARRSVFAYSKGHSKVVNMTPEEILAQRTDITTAQDINTISDRLGDLSDVGNMDKHLAMSKDVALLFIQYQINCESKAEEMPEHDEMKKAEIAHRHFKALKVAGAYAFIDLSPEITEEHAYQAIKLIEASGEAFENLLTRDRAYAKLAKYIANVGRDVTQADLVEDLPFYPKAGNQQRDLMDLAIAYGYQNNIIIKTSFNEGIKFIRGETLQRTDLDNIRVSYSQDIAQGYLNEHAPFDQLHRLTQAKGLHWCNHHLKDGHRQEDNVITGFNMVVLDVDGGVNLETAQMLLKDYKALFYTTKRHTDKDHRFRIILPTNYELYLDAKDYKEFMQNLSEWLPFEIDRQANQRARKWLSADGFHEYQDGELLDVLPFIPKTTKNENRKIQLQDQQSLDNLERWVMNNTGDGNRNNQLLRYAMILVDAGFDFDAIRQKTVSLNDKMPDKLEEAEILGTIMVTVSKGIAKRGQTN